jgi:flagellin-like protein
MLKSKKAISPILATLLLIVITVAAITITYAWIVTYMSSTTQQAGFIPYKANVAFSSSPKSIAIDIGNSGSSSGQIVAIYVGTSASTLQNQTNINPVLPYAIGASTVQSFNITYSSLASGPYYFKVVPSSGAALEFQATAP